MSCFESLRCIIPSLSIFRSTRKMTSTEGSIVSFGGGMIQGTVIKLKDENAKPVHCFRNIPYAKPPTGELRFLEPQLADKWEGLRDGGTHGNIPMQDIQSVKNEEQVFPQKQSPGEEEDANEDCLNLTVYTTCIDQNKAMSVMVWLYGGSFQDGSVRLYDGSALAGMKDVVVVIPNYRLNVFGFFSLGKGSICPGNAGLLDQCMALKWVQQNINAFGGNPANVTIFGESAGAMAVDHHVNSPLSRGLFHKAITHSGQATCSDYFLLDGTIPTKALLKQLGITVTEPKDILLEMQKMPAQKLKLANETLLQESAWNVKFLPCVDDVFLPKAPEAFLEAKDFAKIPYMIGCNNSEYSGGLAMSFCGQDYVKGITKEAFTQLLSPICDVDLILREDVYADKVRDMHETVFSKLYGQIKGDLLFVAPAVATASAHAESHDDVYLYQCCYQPRFSHDDNFGSQECMKAEWCYCDHGDDVYMMLGVPFTPGELRFGAKFSSEEKLLSGTCMTYITNFAKHGNPNAGGVEHVWPKYSTQRRHMILNHTIRVGSNLGGKEVEVWNNYLKRKAD